MLLEYQAWKSSVERERCLLNGLPLPPALAAGESAVPLLTAAPTTATVEGDAPAVPPPQPAAPPPRRQAVKPIITWARAMTKQQLLALLDRQCEADIWAKCGAAVSATEAQQ